MLLYDTYNDMQCATLHLSYTIRLVRKNFTLVDVNSSLRGSVRVQE